MMMTRGQRLSLTAVTLTVFFVVLWFGLHHDPKRFQSPLINKPVPAFQAVSVLTEKPISESVFKHKITVLNVFASWCASCSVEHVFWVDNPMPQGVQLIALDYMDTSEHVKQFLHDRGNPFTDVIADPKGKLGIDFGVYGVPETYLIDKSGVVRMKRVGVMTKEQWQSQWLPAIAHLQEGA